MPQGYTGIRYFEITEMIGLLPMTIVEYVGEFGQFISKAKPFRVEIKQGTQLWIFSSSLYITKGTAEKSCILLENNAVHTVSVDLSIADNPKSKRQPAMRKKAKK